MTNFDILQHALHAFAGIDEHDFALSLPYWQPKQYRKGEFYNEYKNVCKHLGFILDGVFRAYCVDGETGTEKKRFLLLAASDCGVL